MKLFLDTADTEVIKERLGHGLIDGVTTNPSLILKSGRNPEDVYQELVDMNIPDISMEVVGNYSKMKVDALQLIGNFGNRQTTIKVPCTPDGLKVCYELSKMGIRVNVTLIFSLAQAILAAKAGATYVSPFVGRYDDNSISGLELIRSITETYMRQGVRTQVLAASLRDVYKVSRCFYNGAHVVTMPPKIFDKMFTHVLTDKGLDLFDADYNATLAMLSETVGTIEPTE